MDPRPPVTLDPADAFAGVLLGTALGDALGLPHEGLSPGRIARRLGDAPLRHGMLAGRGLVSDDTEHAAMLARALLEAGDDPQRLTQAFAGQLRRWLLTLPPGVGLATLRGSLRLLVGVAPDRSGVDSAGNGPAMRAAILGVYGRARGWDDAGLVARVRATTRITHTDPRAEDGALLIARLAAQLAAGQRDPAIVEAVRDPELRERARAAWTEGLAGLAHDRARGVTGFVVDTVPAAIACARDHEHPQAAIEAAVRLGGDTDTVAAIVGALLGAKLGARGLPAELLAGVRDWPLSLAHLRALAESLATDRVAPRPRWLAALARNLAVTGLLVGHVLLRALGR